LVTLDGYGCRKQQKGGSVLFKPKWIIITSDKHPEEWYNIDSKTYGQLKRRLTAVLEARDPEPDGPSDDGQRPSSPAAAAGHEEREPEVTELRSGASLGSAEDDMEIGEL